MRGKLRNEDGRFVLHFERRLNHPVEKVWRAISDPGKIGRWYPFPVEKMDPRVGGKISFRDEDGTMLDGAITELVPPRVFAFREVDDLLRFELQQPGGEGCLLTFTHTFDDRSASASYAAGWHICLDVLESLLDDRPVSWSQQDRWAELHECYVESFG